MNTFTKEALATALRHYMEENSLTQAQVAEELKVSQAHISRVLNRNWKRKSGRIRKICKAIGVEATADPRQNDELMQALSEVWNGEVDDAKALAKCIRAIGEARKHLPL
ncbi:helix-turn-helix domain-containing protein [Marinobacter shengliensis]|uniref:Helix-turn-helix domain-containing protein n=1 Tax=Marinobacter shengliensis TaxID=1389223 RepID=A0ABV4W3T0_9GAMM